MSNVLHRHLLTCASSERDSAEVSTLATGTTCPGYDPRSDDKCSGFEHVPLASLTGMMLNQCTSVGSGRKLEGPSEGRDITCAG